MKRLSEHPISFIRIFRKPVLCLLLSGLILSGCGKASTGESAMAGAVEPEATATEETTTETTAPTQPQIDWGDFGPVDYEMVREDRSDRSLNKTGHTNALVQADYPVFSGDAAVGPINKAVYQIVENFLSTYSEDEIHQSHYAFGIPYTFSHEAYFNVGQNGDGLLSVSMGYSGFWGEGNYYKGSRSYVYCLKTGKQLTVTQLTGMEEDYLLELFHSVVLKDNTCNYLTEESRERIDLLTLEEYSFSVYEGQIWVSVDDLWNDHSDRISIGGPTGLYLP